MHVELREFLSHLAGCVALALAPVVLVAFVSMPMSLGRHPGEPLLAEAAGQTLPT